MLIYKYVSAKALRGILESQRLGFTHPRDFNDPFDRPRVLRSHFQQPIETLFDGVKTSEEIAQEADEQWDRCVVASFTRTHENALMWSHYADSHKGAVIEIDAETARLTARSLLIPVQFGSVVYLRRPNTSRYDKRALPVFRKDDRFEMTDYERLQRLFLSKPLAWAYEEEVRAVARINAFESVGQSMDDRWTKRSWDCGVAWDFRLEPLSITRVFVGMRFGELDWLRAQAGQLSFAIHRAVPSPDQYEIHFDPDQA